MQASEDIHVACRKALREATGLEKWRGSCLFAAFTILYIIRCSWRVDWEFASTTYRMVEAGFDDLDGVEASQDFYCDKDQDGGTFLWRDTSTNEVCRLDYADIGEMDELQAYLANSLLALPGQIHGTCSECALGITTSPWSLRTLVDTDYICADFQAGGAGDGLGPWIEGCVGEDTETLPLDVAWAANPSSLWHPCCRNQTLIFASLYLTSLAEVETSSGVGDGEASANYTELAALHDSFVAGQPVPTITSFLRRNIHLDGHYVQLVVSRGQRIMGMNFGAAFTDPGCVDPGYVENLLRHGRNYSAEALLDACWADELVTPVLRIWSYRYDDAFRAPFLAISLAFYAVLALDMTHTLLTIYSYLPEECHPPGEPPLSAWTALRIRLTHPPFLLLELPSWALPILADVLEHQMDLPAWTVLLGASQLLVCIRCFTEAEAFEPVEQVVMAINNAGSRIGGLFIVIVVSCFAFTSIFGQLFGVFHFQDGGLGTYPDLWLEMFHVLIAGAEVNEEDFTFNPFGVAIMYLVANLFLFLIMSQVFIAILCSSFDSAHVRRDSIDLDLSLPSSFEDVGAVRHWCAMLWRFPVYLLTGYDVEYAVVQPLMLHALCRVVAEADARTATKAQVLLPQRTLQLALVEAGVGTASAARCAEALGQAWGARPRYGAEASEVKGAATGGGGPTDAPLVEWSSWVSLISSVQRNELAGCETTLQLRRLETKVDALVEAMNGRATEERAAPGREGGAQRYRYLTSRPPPAVQPPAIAMAPPRDKYTPAAPAQPEHDHAQQLTLVPLSVSPSGQRAEQLGGPATARHPLPPIPMANVSNPGMAQSPLVNQLYGIQPRRAQVVPQWR